MSPRFSRLITPVPQSALVAHIQREGQAVTCSANDWLDGPFRQPRVYYICAGWLERRHVLPNNRSAVTATYVPGDIINLDALCEREAYGRLCALTPFEGVGLDARNLATAIECKPALAMEVIQRLVAEGDWLREAVSALGQMRAREKIIYYIGQTRRRQLAYGTLDPEQPEFDFPITQMQLAGTLGMSAVHCSRSLSELREMGLLHFRQKRIEVPDLARFEAIFDALSQPTHWPIRGPAREPVQEGAAAVDRIGELDEPVL